MSNSRESTSFGENLFFDHQQLMDTLNHMTMRYGTLTIGYLGESILGKGIPMITLGHGNKEILYVGAHHGMEWITSLLLVRFLKDFWEIEAHGKSIYGVLLEQLCNRYTVYVIPMLNPDGVGYQIHGVEKSNPLFERVLQMNGGSSDFSCWQANARGVDLNYNYDAGFAKYKESEGESKIPCGAPARYSGESPESEPEVAALCNFIRFHTELCGVLTLHTQGEQIFYGCSERIPSHAYTVAKKISLLSGYKLLQASEATFCGGLADWCAQAIGIPSFAMECGRGKNPLPLSDASLIYTRLRKLFFLFPTMF